MTVKAAKQRRAPRPWRVSLRHKSHVKWTTNVYTTKAQAIEAAESYRECGWDAHVWHKNDGKPLAVATDERSQEGGTS